jgi:uncharacterized protein YsxB (DUF464 family)
VETFSVLDFSFDWDEKKGYLKFSLSETNEKSDLLLESFFLGMKGIRKSHKNYLEISEELYVEN